MKGFTMKKIINILLITLITSIIFALDVFAAEAKQWKIGHVRPEGSAIDNDTEHLVQKIQEKTNGDITFTIYPDNKLGDYTIVQEKCAFGEVEMYIGPLGTTMNRKNALAFTPYLVKNWDEAKEVYAHDSTLMQHMEKQLLKQNIKLLGGWPVYFGGIVLTEKPPNPKNPNIKKNMIIRVPPIRSFSYTAKALGYTPYPITWEFARDGLKTGMVEGMIGGGAEGYLGLNKDIAKYYLHIKDHFEHWFIYMNLDVWNNLSQKNKQIIQEEVLAMEKDRFAVAKDKERDNLSKLSEQGTKIITFSDNDLQKISNKIRDKVWPSLQEDIGPPFEDVINNLPEQ